MTTTGSARPRCGVSARGGEGVVFGWSGSLSTTTQGLGGEGASVQSAPVYPLLMGKHTPPTSTPMASPAWLPSLVASRGEGTWSRLPLPLAPHLKRRPMVVAAPAVAAAAAAAAVAKAPPVSGSVPSSVPTDHPPLPVCGDGVTQAAFTARTPAGASVLVFFTGILMPAGGGGGGMVEW